MVLAREVLVEADTPFDARDIVRGLVASQPGSFVYASDGFVGASPELLVRRTGDVVESRPVAGTTVADSDEALLALAASVKDTREHRFVVDGIVEALDARCAALSRRAARPRSRCSARSRTSPRRSAVVSTPPVPGALELARLLHPTPAVGGTPRPAALARSARSRASTAAATPARSAGSTPAATASGPSRCAAPSSTAPAPASCAGAGIVAGSDPDAEWAETQAKLEPMLRALVRP